MQQFRQTETSETTPRYDTETVKAVLARATQIEAQDAQERLSAEQVETLGKELGIAPDAVRRALGELGASQTVPTTTPRRNGRTVGEEIILVVRSGMAYFSLLVTLFFLLERNSVMGHIVPLLIFLVFFAPALVSGWMGWTLKKKRLGVPTALIVSSLAVFAPLIGIYLSSGRWIGVYGSMELLFAFLSVAASFVMACVGSWVREGYDSPPRKKDR